ERFVSVVRKKPTAIALLLMDQAVISGIGNVYRAEMLFRARQNPFTPGREVREEVVRALWRDWVHLLRIGFDTGLMYTMDDEATGDPEPEHWVYQRAGEPCRVCGTPIAMQILDTRKLYWCPVDQA
ncbi:MAG TPA: zinc finger domain-containing protein, partial [Pseudolysinimonas sp.]